MSAEHAVAVIMAAGLGTRMGAGGAKTMRTILGRPLLAWILDLCEDLGMRDIIVITNPNAPETESFIQSQNRKARLHSVPQSVPLGTAHAVSMALPKLKDLQQTHCFILSGDVPNLRQQSLRHLMHAAKDGLGVLTAVLDDAAAYGRIVRDDDGKVMAIVEAKDCTPEQLKIREINTSIYYAPKSLLFNTLPLIKNENKAKEYYLTDMVALAREQNVDVFPSVLDDAREGEGVNTVEELQAAENYRKESM